MTDTTITHGELCIIAERFLRNNGFKVAFHDRFIAAVSTGEQPDALAFRNLASCLVEAKVSRSDFLADRKKRFRVNPELGMGDWRFFICEPGLISIEELPEGWGLLHSKMDSLLRSLIMKEVRESDVTSIREMDAKIDRVCMELSRVFTHLTAEQLSAEDA